jgi:hypothetical protein
MYIFTLHVQCVDRFIEILSQELETAELMVEHLVSQVLLALFDTVILEDVSLHLRPGRSSLQPDYLLHIYAQCADILTPLLADHLDAVELVLEETICCALIELFGTVLVVKITVSVK